jgi:guanosine-3',5'-bis(diphosphate) 3'-pyrophosphohydrolase
MQARNLGVLLRSVYLGANFHRAERRADGAPYINASLLELQRLYTGGERELSVLCEAVLEGTGTSFATVDAGYELIGDEHTYTDAEVAKIVDALAFAATKHRDQNRKDAEQSPYIIHPIEVLNIVYQIGAVRDLVTLLACILHDTVEDTGTTLDELSATFGADVSGVVAEVTDDKSLPKATRKRLQVEHAAHKSDRAKYLKYGDKSANCADVQKAQGWPAERMREYIEWSSSILVQFKGLNPRLDAHFEAVAAAVLAQLECKS